MIRHKNDKAFNKWTKKDKVIKFRKIFFIFFKEFKLFVTDSVEKKIYFHNRL